MSVDYFEPFEKHIKKATQQAAKNREREECKRIARIQRPQHHPFGITKKEYGDRVRLQNNLCLICGKSEESRAHSGKVKRLAVDHDHRTGKVRGLLCQKCNTILGLSDDSIDLLKKCIDYLT